MNMIESDVSKWPGVEVQSDRNTVREFTLGSAEIGYLHDDSNLDILFTKRIRDLLIEEGRIEPYRDFPDSGWVTYQIRSDKHVDDARWLLRLSYLYRMLEEQLRDGEHPELDTIDIDAELTRLGVSNELRRLFDKRRDVDANTIEFEVSEWPGIEIKPHRFNAREFVLGETEIGHLHNRRELDIPFAKRIRDILIEEGIAQIHDIAPNSGWVSFHVDSDDDSERARWLLRLSYLYHVIILRKRKTKYLEVDGIDIDAELAELNMSNELRRIFDEVRNPSHTDAARFEES